MTKDELKKKIVKVLKETINWTTDYSIPIGIVYKSELDKIADALISAGIGDVKDVEAEANRYEMLYKLQNRDMALAERRAHDAEHRAEVAEMALKKFAENITCEDCPFFSDCASSEKMEDLMHSNYCFAEYLKQAEKELAEEEKDDYQGCFEMYLKKSEKDLAEEKK